MSLSLALVFLVNAIFINAKSIQIEIVNPCTPDGLYTLQYYYPYPSDDSRFIECDPWGQMYVKMCPQGSKWNSWISSCVIQVPDDNIVMPKVMIYNESQSCSFYGNSTCQNGGYCNQFIIESKCFCPSNFVGDFCEVASPSMGAFGQLINDSFSIELYKRQRPLSSDSLAFNTTFDTSIVLDELTKKRVEEYLVKYPNGEMRFDTLINYLVQDFLSQLYPSAFYLREFLMVNEVAMGYTSAIPNLLQTAKYSYDNFDNLFKIFEEVLNRLAAYLPKHMPQVKEEAQSFFNVYDMIFTRFTSVGNFTKLTNFTSEMPNKTDLTREEMKESIHDDFNTTLSLSYDLFRYLNRFDDDLSVKGANYTSDQMQQAIVNFTADSITTQLLSDVSVEITSIWDSMSFYGFWYIISSFVVPNANVVSKHVPFSVPSPHTDAPVIVKKLSNEALLPEISQDLSTPIMPVSQTSTSRPSNIKVRSHNDELKPTTTSPVSTHKHHHHSIVSTTVAVTPSVAHLSSDSTVIPVFTSQSIPSTGALISDVLASASSTTVLPTSGLLLDEKSTVVPKSTTIKPKHDSLVSESTIVMPTSGAIVIDTTVIPRAGALVGETTRPVQTSRPIPVSTTIKPKHDSLVSGSTIAMPTSGLLLDDQQRSTSAIPKSTTVKPKNEALVSESTIAMPTSGLLLDDQQRSTTAIPKSTTVKPKHEALVSESTIAMPTSGLLLDEQQQSTTAIPKSTSVKPKHEALVSESTIVMPTSGAISIELKSSTIAIETTVIPRAGALVGETTLPIQTSRPIPLSTTVKPKHESLVSESTIIMPTSGLLLDDQQRSTTAIPKQNALVSETTTVVQKMIKTETPLKQLMNIPTTVVPKVTPALSVIPPVRLPEDYDFQLDF
jgi:hypothetical protein